MNAQPHRLQSNTYLCWMRRVRFELSLWTSHSVVVVEWDDCLASHPCEKLRGEQSSGAAAVFLEQFRSGKWAFTFTFFCFRAVQKKQVSELN